MPNYEINLIPFPQNGCVGQQYTFTGTEEEAIAKMNRSMAWQFEEGNVFELRGKKRIHIKTNFNRR